MTSSLVSGAWRRSTPRTLGVACVSGALALSALWAWLPLARLQQWLGAERGLDVALGRARLAAGGRGLCVLLGDSRIEALGSWPATCHVVNLGRSGSQARRWRSWLPTLDAGLPDDAQIVVWIGINDLVHRRAPAETVARDLIALLRGLARAERRVLVLPQLPVYAAVTEQTLEALNAASQRIDEQLRRELAGMPNLRLLAPAAFGLGAGGPEPGLYRDGLHLSEATDARLRAELTQALKPGERAP